MREIEPSVLALIVTLVTLAIVIVRCLTRRRARVEGYGDVMAGLAPYQQPLATCLAACEQEDPNTRMMQGNIPCDRRCYNMYTDMAKRGIEPEHSSNETTCRERCANTHSTDAPARKRCENACHCQREVEKWCQQSCTYTDQDTAECIRQCAATMLTNCNQVSWMFR